MSKHFCGSSCKIIITKLHICTFVLCIFNNNMAFYVAPISLGIQSVHDFLDINNLSVFYLGENCLLIPYSTKIMLH